MEQSTAKDGDSETPKEKESKYHRYYWANRDAINEKRHRRYYLKIHGLTNPPPLRPNLKVKHPSL